MTAALTPELAIAYVRELSADVRAVVVLDAEGARLAGPEALQASARALLEALGEAADAALRLPGGVVVATRSADCALVAVAGPLALVGPTLLDARAAVGCTAPTSGGDAPSAAVRTAGEAAVCAVRHLS